MNKFIKEQLLKCKNCVIPEFDDNTNQLIISKKVKEDTSILENHNYKVKLADYIINEPANFTLSVNWNHGTKPLYSDMIVTIVRKMGKMIYINGSYLNFPKVWEGWVPEKSLTILEEID